MDISNMLTISVNEIDQAITLIRYRKTFAISDAVNTTDIAQKIEEIIEKQGLTCRLYTANRIASVLLAPIAGVGIALHNLFTFNPDYEVIKCLLDNQVVVVYKK